MFGVPKWGWNFFLGEFRFRIIFSLIQNLRCLGEEMKVSACVFLWREVQVFHSFRIVFIYFYFKKSFGMEQVLVLLQGKLSWKESMRKTCKTNNIHAQIINAFTPLRFRASLTRFRAIYQRRDTDKAQRWLQNQLKALYWFFVAISCANEINIKDFTQKEWNLICEVFQFKQRITLEYEGKKLIEESTNKPTWQAEEQQLLMGIVQENEEIGSKWNEYARKLYQLSEQRYFRTGKQCRERWLNHLDPNKKHGEWEHQQDRELAKMFINEGKKWSLVSKKLGGSRTEHMVKNRFKTLISRQKKLYPQISNEFSLLKTFLDPQCAQRYIKKENGELQKKKQAQIVKTQQKPSDQSHKFEISIKRELQLNAQIDQFIKDDENDVKNVPQTSAAFQLAQPFSPWYVITPTFSPYYVSVPTFSAYDASLVNNQFYFPKGNQQNEQN